MIAADAVLEFWFGTLESGFAAPGLRDRWFEQSDAFDAEIATRFASVLADAAAGALDDWRDKARSALAFVIVTDQFSRQIFRGSADAFATDTLALATAREGIDRGFDQTLAFDERAFFYLPLEHSESIEDQDLCVRLFTALRDATPKGFRHLTGDYLRHAHAHRDTIARFGRFPYRNDALGRASTEEERQWLASRT